MKSTNNIIKMNAIVLFILCFFEAAFADQEQRVRTNYVGSNDYRFLEKVVFHVIIENNKNKILDNEYKNNILIYVVGNIVSDIKRDDSALYRYIDKDSINKEINYIETVTKGIYTACFVIRNNKIHNKIPYDNIILVDSRFSRQDAFDCVTRGVNNMT